MLTNHRMGRALAAGATLAAALPAGMLATAPNADAAARPHGIGHGFAIARHQEGDPYAYGAAGPGRFDCSGLVYYSFRKAGFHHVPRTASAQARHMNRIPKHRLRKGDFVFFYDGAARPGNVYHVGVYAGWHHGHRTVIHAPTPGERVKREPIWTSHWFGGTLRGL